MPRLDLWIWWRAKLTPPNFESARFNLQYLLPNYLLSATGRANAWPNRQLLLFSSFFNFFPRLSTVRLLEHCLSHVELMRCLYLVCCGSEFFKMPGSKSGSRAVVSNLTIWDSLRRSLFLAISFITDRIYFTFSFLSNLVLSCHRVLPWGVYWLWHIPH